MPQAQRQPAKAAPTKKQPPRGAQAKAGTRSAAQTLFPNLPSGEPPTRPIRKPLPKRKLRRRPYDHRDS
jgi:hypothetical protein